MIVVIHYENFLKHKGKLLLTEWFDTLKKYIIFILSSWKALPPNTQMLSHTSFMCLLHFTVRLSLTQLSKKHPTYFLPSSCLNFYYMEYVTTSHCTLYMLIYLSLFSTLERSSMRMWNLYQYY